MDLDREFDRERPRLVRIAAHVLGDPVEAEDVVQQAWLRLTRSDDTAINNLPGWLTTVVTRLCLDRLKAVVPAPREPLDRAAAGPDPADEVALADSVAAALHVVLSRLPGATVAQAEWRVVDAFLAAARNGEFSRLLELLAPDVVVAGDPVAVAIGTPARIDGRDAAATFFEGAAAAALPVFVHDRPGAAWFDRGVARVVFDFRVSGGVVTRIDFCAEPAVLETVSRRRGGDPR